MNISNYLEHLINGGNLEAQDMRTIMQACMQNQLTDAQIAAFLVLMRQKGETVEELTVAAEVMLEFAHKIDLGSDLIDIVGTGGDKKNTFNVSTVSSIVTAAAGIRVAKHGNRSVSSRSGSADLLEHAGIQLELNDKQLKDCLNQFNVCFLFAPHFHQALQYARPARRELGIRTFFNLLGPLVNPAHVKKYVIGVFDKRWQQPIAQVQANLGCERALVVTSDDGMDEISIAAPTTILDYHNGQLTTWRLDPKDYACFHASLTDITVNSVEESLAIIKRVLHGELGPARDIVRLNSAAAIYCANANLDYQTALSAATKAIDSGKALEIFNQLAQFNDK